MVLKSKLKLLGLLAAASVALAGYAFSQAGQGTLTTLFSTYYVPVQVPGSALNNNASLATLEAYFDSTGQGVASGVAPTVFHSGGYAPPTVTSGTVKTATNTETYIVEMFVPVNTTLTGIKWIGTASSTGNVQFSLATSAGVPIAAAQTASTATTASAAYQTAAFVTPYVALGPRKYFILMQNSSSSNQFLSQLIGNFGAAVKTGEIFGTFTTVTAPTTFTTGLGPVADTY